MPRFTKDELSQGGGGGWTRTRSPVANTGGRLVDHERRAKLLVGCWLVARRATQTRESSSD
jgi:hypothetical protein